MELSERQRSEKDYFNKYFLAHPYPGYGCFKMLEGARRPYNVDWFSLQLIVDQGLKDKSVLNLGCGLGIKSLLFAKFGARESWGCDISEVAVKTSEALKEALEERDRIQFFVMPAETLRFENERFDYVFGEWVLHHVDIPKAISEVRRVLKKGGRAVFCEWLQWPLFDKIRNRKLIRRLFPAGGFARKGERYVTAYERKLNVDELQLINDMFSSTVVHKRYFFTRIPIFFHMPYIFQRYTQHFDYVLFKAFPGLRDCAAAGIIECVK